MKKHLSTLLFCLAIPIAVVGGALVFREKQYAWISLCVVLLSCIGFFLHFERNEKSAKRITLTAALTALVVLSRCVFAALPSFKPVSALVILIALYFGKETGFVVGALSAVISNFYFSQGAWTPFQMFAWGMVGFIAGIFAEQFKKHKLLLFVYGGLSGIMYSFILDVWTVIWMDGYFNIARYITSVISSARVTGIYVVSNIVFLIVLYYPVDAVFGRIKTKYAL